MKIVQITDIHIGPDGADPLGIDVRANFLRVLPAARRLDPDLLVLSGDLCFRDPDPEVYAWIRPHVEALGLPFECISGNHDDPVLMANAFGRTKDLRDQELYFARWYDDLPILFLDTTHGYLSEPQLAWLEKELAGTNGERYIFMHHPPLYGGVPHMDNNYALRNPEDFFKILGKGPARIFCGHYHVDKVLQRDLVTVYITPSTFFQIDQRKEDFAVDHARPGLREIIIDEKGLRTSTYYP